ncbi:MAG: hypothetical protein D6732_10145 [Methanobacteriota archaeon]|nr:MAG: hypothetical protein D6732_10145 [Euryarchaeota archaeon]
MIPIVIMIFWIGVYPSTFLNKTEATVKALIKKVQVAKVELRLEQGSNGLAEFLFNSDHKE